MGKVSSKATHNKSHQRVFTHFKKRVRERIGKDVDAKILSDCIRTLIHKEDWRHIQCMGRISRDGRRLWRFKLKGKGTFFAIFDHNLDAPVTVMAAKGKVNRIRKWAFDLEVLAQ